MNGETVALRVGGGLVHVEAALWDALRGPKPPPTYESNGCGPAWSRAPRWLGRLVRALVPDRLHGWPLAAACHGHDWRYGCGGTWADRRRADRMLASHLYTICDWYEVSPLRSAFVALAYWIAVRLWGWTAFRYLPSEQPVGRVEHVRERLLLFRDKT